MLGLSKLWTAISRLAGAIDGLAETAEAANHQARVRLGLDTPDRAQLSGEVVEAPEPEPANGKGRRRK